MGQYDEAERWARKALEIDPDSGPGHYRLGWTHVRRGMLEQAIEDFRNCQSQGEASLAHALGLAGRETEARKILGQWLEKSRRGWAPAVEVANIYVGLGEVDQALDWLEKACETRDSGWLPVISTEANFESLFGNPRFNDLLLRMGQKPIEPVSSPRRSRKAEGKS
jgi:tetratricopeptide (TPR) repeat protein